jgi:hypothetical protein
MSPWPENGLERRLLRFSTICRKNQVLKWKINEVTVFLRSKSPLLVFLPCITFRVTTRLQPGSNRCIWHTTLVIWLLTRLTRPGSSNDTKFPYWLVLNILNRRTGNSPVLSVHYAWESPSHHTKPVCMGIFLNCMVAGKRTAFSGKFFTTGITVPRLYKRYYSCWKHTCTPWA